MAEMFSGLTAPNWWQSPSGLWLHSTARAQAHIAPQDMRGRRFEHLLVAERPEVLSGVAAFATPEFVGQRKLEIEEIQRIIPRLPRENWLLAISGLQAQLWAIQVDVDKHFDLAADVFSGTPAWPGIRSFLQNGAGARVAFSEQGLTLLQWLVIVGGRDAPAKRLNSREQGLLRMVLLGVASHIDVQADRTLGGKPDDWLYYLTQNFAFNSKPMIANAIGRTWQIYGRLARELGENDVPS